ncbi:type III pantothenate kinase [Croceicoccus sp. F390]|uniref:Type III pantothenate kinase n=1 Tax=Croceicoccus esteveae TaxID=3075597 RepID=A0ABU2ZFX5_9SPHN|nr:type III pantothenate kinase [Croceicoccus sp. F390]MDT0575497.1 type III pantothenate kinase [Croceicoccus sp. F390]
MLLAIDVGNTNIVFALMKEGKVCTRWRLATDARRTADEYAVWLMQLFGLEGYDFKAIEQVIVSTVVPAARHNIAVLAKKYFSVPAWFAGEGAASWTIAIDVDEPGSLGADRAVNAIAAHERVAGDLIVIDFGTATTLDVVDFGGAYKGGIIAPGINLSLDALINAAARLPRIAIEAPTQTVSVIGRNTEAQMHIGVYWGYVAMLEGLVARLKKEIGRPAKVIATGGLAILFDKHTQIFDLVEVDLTLHGLALLADRAGKQT